MTAASEIAKTLIHLAEADPDEEPITPLRLHKLLYYCQGWHLAWYGLPLFPDRIEAWREGPVVPAVYQTAWGKGRQAIPDQGQANLPDSERASVEQVWSHYRRFSAKGLRDKTRDEPPWKSHYLPDGRARCSEEIPTSELAVFFGAEFERQTGEKPGTMSATGRGIPLEQLRKELGC